MNSSLNHSFAQWFLFFRSLVRAVFLPGTVTVYIPYRIVSERGLLEMESWTMALSFGLVLVLTGFAILLHCIWNFAVIGCGTLSMVDAPRKLVVQGLYRYVRNPMYVGVLMVLFGETVFFESKALFWYAGTFFLIIHFVIVLIEEPGLRNRFGGSYERYCQSVRRWLPGKPVPIETSQLG